MHNTLAVARRVLMQFRHDPRTLAIMLIAPCIVLWLFSVLLGSSTYAPHIATVDVPQGYMTYLSQENCSITDTDATTAADLLAQDKVDAVLSMGDDNTLEVEAEGADASKTAATMSTVRSALVNMQRAGKAELQQQVDSLIQKAGSIDFNVDSNMLALLPDDVRQSISTAQTLSEDIPDIDAIMPITSIETSWFHGSGDWTSFEFYGPVFIGIFIFVFVFLTSSMSLLTERSGGTVKRFIATPVRSWQIVGGYVLGFGLLTLVQSAIILWACIYLIGFPNVGSLFLVVLITISMALVSLTLGLLVSGLAHTPFQVVQLMIVFVVPQILLSGIFDLSQTPAWMQAIASLFPIYYGADALRNVMLRGAGFSDVASNIGILWGFITIFFVLACLNFRKPIARRLKG